MGVGEAGQGQPGQPDRVAAPRRRRSARRGQRRDRGDPAVRRPRSARPARRSAPVGQPGVLGAVASARSSACQLLQHVGQRGDAGRAVGVGGVLGGGVRDPGRVADEQHRGRHVRGEHARRRARRRWAGPARRRAASASRSRSAGVERGLRRRPTRRSARPRCRRGRPARRPASRPPSTSSSSVDCSAARASSQARHRGRDRVGGVGLDRDPADGGVRAGAAGPPCWRPAPCSAKVSIGSRRSAIRVVPAWLPSPVKSSRHRPCGQIALATPTGASSVDQRAALLDVQLDEGADAGRAGPGPAPPAGRRRPCASAKRDPVAVAQRRRAVAGSIAPVSSREPRQATPNRAPSSSANAATADRPGRGDARGAQLVDGEERADDAERPVVRPAVRHRVEVAAGDAPRRRPPGRPTRRRGCRCRRSVDRRARGRAACSRNQSRQRQLRLGPARTAGSRRCRRRARSARARPTAPRNRSARSSVTRLLSASGPGRRCVVGDLARPARSRRRRAGSRPCRVVGEHPFDLLRRPARCRRRRRPARRGWTGRCRRRRRGGWTPRTRRWRC